MKFIFDFDDVLFNTKKFKEHMYVCLEKAGINRSAAEEYYAKPKGARLWLKELLSHFSVRNDLYEEILNKSKNFINMELLNIIRKLGKENCYIVSYGNEEFQKDKINRTQIGSLFSEIMVVPESKKGAIEEICAKHMGEKVIFVDDKVHHFKDLDFKKCPNLKTILYDEHGLEKLKSEINN